MFVITAGATAAAAAAVSAGAVAGGTLATAAGLAGGALAGLVGAAIVQEKKRRKHPNLPTPPDENDFRSAVIEIGVKPLEETTTV